MVFYRFCALCRDVACNVSTLKCFFTDLLRQGRDAMHCVSTYVQEARSADTRTGFARARRTSGAPARGIAAEPPAKRVMERIARRKRATAERTSGARAVAKRSGSPNVNVLIC
jgi:hypothetical protein